MNDQLKEEIIVALEQVVANKPEFLSQQQLDALARHKVELRTAGNLSQVLKIAVEIAKIIGVAKGFFDNT